MSRTNVRTISVNLNAGTARFFVDLDAAKGKLREFGTEGVSSHIAVSGAAKLLHGDFLNNTRAADRFVESVLGLGSVAQKMFPLVGGLAFAGMIVAVGVKVYDFFKNMQEAAAKTAAAFRGVEAPLRLTNDELAITNQRLENDIAKLEGKHQNTLALALLEAKKAADGLADSLDKDLSKLQEVLEKEKVGWWQLGTAGTRDLAPMVEKFRAEHADLAATTPAAKLPAAELELLKKQIGEVDDAIQKAKDKAAASKKDLANLEAEGGGSPEDIRGFAPDQTDRLKQLGVLRSQMEAEALRNTQTQASTSLEGHKQALEATKEKTAAVDPYAKKMDELREKLKGVNAELAAVGQSHSAQVLTKAFAEANVELVKIGDELKNAGKPPLTPGQADAMRASFGKIATGEDQTAFAETIDSATKKLQDEIAAQDELTAAISKGYDAVRKAHAEAEVEKTMGPERYDANSEEAGRLRAAALTLYDSQQAEKSAVAVKGLHQEIALEKALAAAQGEGAEAVRQAALAIKLRQMAEEHASAAQIQAAIDRSNAQRENTISADIAKINERIAATERLTAAIGKGADAVRAATLANQLAEIEREGDIPVPGMPGLGQRALAAGRASATDHSQQVAETAAHADRLQILNDQAKALTEAKQTVGETLALDIELRNLENERLQELVKESLQLGSVRDGMRAFFIEMQEDAEKASQIIYAALNSALDRSSSNLAKLMTGQKTDWAKSFQQTGEQMAESSVKSMAKQGLGKLGSLFGVDVGVGKPDGTAANPLWVKMAGSSLPGAVVGGSVSASATKAASGGFGAFLMKMLGIGGGANADGGGAAGGAGESLGTDAAPDFGGWMASGGDVEPGTMYMTGERGIEPFIPNSPGSILPTSALGARVSITNHIDARGADLGASNRIARAIEMSHDASVAAAIQSVHERSLRVPEK